MKTQTLELAHSILAFHDAIPTKITPEVWQDMQELAQAVVELCEEREKQESEKQRVDFFRGMFDNTK